MKLSIFATSFTLLASTAIADGHASSQGDAAAGEEQFNGQCVACHVVANENGDILAGRSAKIGPNLYGVAGRQIGSAENFRYSRPLRDFGETGVNWTEDGFVGFVQDPTAWLREASGDGRARSKMSYKLRDEGQAFDIYAFLSGISE